MLSVNRLKLPFLSFKNSPVIVFTILNHENESPQILERNSPSKAVNFAPQIHLLRDHMMPASTAFYLNVTFFSLCFDSTSENRFYQSLAGAEHNYFCSLEH